MNDGLAQALQLTVVGMGMTFAAIGLLVLSVYLITYLTRQRNSGGSDMDKVGRENGMSETNEKEPELAATPYDREQLVRPDHDLRRRAAAAAVAVALAQHELPALLRDRKETPRHDLGTVAWDHYVRSLRLSQRLHYELRRSHR